MKLADLLDQLFPEGHDVEVQGDALSGTGKTAAGEVAIIGTTNNAYVGVEIALYLAAQVLDIMCSHPKRPILMLVDTVGQRLSRRDEMLGINGYFAHLAKALAFARNAGHRLIALVYAEAVSGGFLSFGLMADEIHSLADAKVRVMNLPAMARVTKLPLERLEQLSRTSPVFAPGVENYVRMGGVHSVWEDAFADRLVTALQGSDFQDRRRELGMQRKGRTQAHAVAQRVREAQ
jgi:malonate decarboxylase gamma subunit